VTTKGSGGRSRTRSCQKKRSKPQSASTAFDGVNRSRVVLAYKNSYSWYMFSIQPDVSIVAHLANEFCQLQSVVVGIVPQKWYLLFR
jgi:hypothetical protein